MASSNRYFADQVPHNLNKTLEKKYQLNADNSEESDWDSKEFENITHEEWMNKLL